MTLLYAEVRDMNAHDLLTVSDPETRSRALACRRPGRGLEIALGRYLARVLAAEYAGIEPGQVTLCHDPAGKPYFADSSLHVSISRSDGMALALAEPHKAVCDLQGIRRFPGQAVRGFFSAGEYETISASPEPDRIMTRLFCRRECLVKWLGSRPGNAGWDAEMLRQQAAPDAVFFETELSGRLVCVLGPAESVRFVRMTKIGGDS
ncbi:MAG: 4'-phosphopantetheinyl transferase superfamily protein [Clostridia bacterium]|nr:4'-phosphopantetheinyl transferase superfamily protein [Clostridia bacterium]